MSRKCVTVKGSCGVITSRRWWGAWACSFNVALAVAMFNPLYTCKQEKNREETTISINLNITKQQSNKEAITQVNQ